MVSEKASFCPSCGFPFRKQQRISNSNNNFDKSIKWIKIIIYTVLCVYGVGMLLNCFFDHDERPPEEKEKLQMYSSVEDVSKNIKDTYWTFTRDLNYTDGVDRWYRLHFTDGKLYFYEVSPSEGDWGEPLVVAYEIEEKRYSNNGERYVRIRWDGILDITYTFIPSTKMLHWHSTYGRGGEIGFMYEGDSNPWN